VRWFEDVYYLKRLVLAGDDVRVLHAYAGDWQVSGSNCIYAVDSKQSNKFEYVEQEGFTESFRAPRIIQ